MTRLSRTVAECLKIQNPVLRKAVMEGEWKYGPPSLKTKRAKLAYKSPQGLKEVFPLAYEIIEKEKSRHYAEAEKISEQLKSSSSSIPSSERHELQSKLTKHLVRAELNDPEVQYNYRMKTTDMREPVFRHLARREWEQYDMLLTMQRLEQLHVIPDTLPTLDPKVAVSLQFPGPINKWVTPGEILRNIVCCRSPILKIQEFDEIPDNSLYSIVVVDPDTPDVENDTFKTTLHWAVSNVPLSNADPNVDLSKADEIVSYLPPHPEKNTPTHRYCLWVFRQATEPGEIRRIEKESVTVGRDNFDVRNFVEDHKLTAVGAHVWRVDYDLSTEEVREKFGLGPGRVFSRTRL